MISVPDGVHVYLGDDIGRLVGEFEEHGPLDRNWEGVCRVVRAPDELRRASGDSVEEMEPLEITDEFRSHDLIV